MPSLLPCLQQLLELEPYSLRATEKTELYEHALLSLTRHHDEHCPAYRRVVRMLGYDPSRDLAVDQFPFIPVRLFKEFDLSSVALQDVTRTITSSGTSGQTVADPSGQDHGRQPDQGPGQDRLLLHRWKAPAIPGDR